MKTRKILIAYMIFGIISFGFTGVVVNAAENAKVDTNISFIESEEVTNPVDPDDPEQELEEDGTGAVGPLSIDYVSSLNFGQDILISNTTEEYLTITNRPHVQVTDLRGTGAGWELTASLSGFEDENGNESLRGSKIVKINPSTISVNTFGSPTIENSIVLESDGSTTSIMSAKKDEGMGTWVARFYGETASTKLVVLGGTAKVGNNTATITWNLHTTP